MAQSIAVKAKQSVDETVDSYLGRLALLLSIVVASGFAVAGLWIVFVEIGGALFACAVLALIFFGISAAIQSTITAAERRAAAKLTEVEKSFEPMTAALPFDLNTITTYAPVVLPLLAKFRRYIPIVVLAALIFISWPQKTGDQNRA